MKIVHINTIDTGGAANAAIRLSDALNERGVQSKVLVLHKTGFHPDVIKFKVPSVFNPSFLFKKICNRIWRMRFGSTFDSIKSRVEFFSRSESIYNVLDHPITEEADLIHLHWISDFVDLPSFFSKYNGKIVWTFHDENPIMGGLHYSGDLARLDQHQAQFEKALWKLKLKHYADVPKLNVISPSSWLQNQITLSTTNSHFKKVNIIHNGLPDSWFDDDRKSMNLNLPEGKTLIALVGSSLDVYRKGFDIFIEMLNDFSEYDNVTFILVGSQIKKKQHKHCVYLGVIEQESKLQNLYRSVDATLIPSRQDNLPNVMLESLASGTPVIAFQVGGMKDVIEPNIDGVLAENISAHSLSSAVRLFLETKGRFNRTTIRERAKKRFHIKRQVDLVTSLYSSCINNND